MSVYRHHQAEHPVLPEGTPLATFGQRAGAMLVDVLAIFLVWIPLAMLVGFLISKGVLGHAPQGEVVMAANAGPGRWVFLPVGLLYFTLGTWLGHGRTLGKWLFKIRVASLEHRNLTLWICLERTLGYFASMLEFGFGFIQFFLHPNRQTVHDRIAETVVIRR